MGRCPIPSLYNDSQHRCHPIFPPTTLTFWSYVLQRRYGGTLTLL